MSWSVEEPTRLRGPRTLKDRGSAWIFGMLVRTGNAMTNAPPKQRETTQRQNGTQKRGATLRGSAMVKGPPNIFAASRSLGLKPPKARDAHGKKCYMADWQASLSLDPLGSIPRVLQRDRRATNLETHRCKDLCAESL